MSSSNSDTIELKKVRIEDLDRVQHAEYGMKALRKAARYLEFFNQLDTGMEASVNMIRDLNRMKRALRHRLDVLKDAA